jgi:hypothetical protein
MKKKLVSFQDKLYQQIADKAEDNRRPINTEIIMAVEFYLTTNKK